MLNLGGMDSMPAAAGSGGSGVQIITMLPAGFTGTEIGGFQLGEALAGGGSGGSTGTGGSGGSSAPANGNCGNVLVGVARDFQRADEGGNPDFESPIFWGNTVTPNLVAPLLGPDQKPVYGAKCDSSGAPKPACPYGAEMTTAANFSQWYNDTPSMNQAFKVSLYLAPQPGGLFTFQSLFYFPVDGTGYGASGMANDMMMHNFGFTTELHTQFTYNGGETFQFQGDDDVWVFVNGKLAVDLGGLHPRMLGTVILDDAATELGLEKGKIYGLDLFHAERHTDKSTFRIDTNLTFVNCGSTEVIPK